MAVMNFKRSALACLFLWLSSLCCFGQYLYVSDTDRVDIFSPTGDFLSYIPIGGSGPGRDLVGEEPQPGLVLLERTDVDHRAQCAERPALAVALDRPTRPHPGPGTVLAAEAVLVRPRRGPALDRVRHRTLHALEVLRVDALPPPGEMSDHFAGVVAEDRLDAVVPAHRFTVEVPFPDGLESDAREKPVAGLAREQQGHMPFCRHFSPGFSMLT